jgi:hypothetical protein
LKEIAAASVITERLLRQGSLGRMRLPAQKAGKTLLHRFGREAVIRRIVGVISSTGKYNATL